MSNLHLQPQASLGSILAKGLKVNIRQYAMFIALLALWAFFWAVTPDHVFLSARNLTILLLQNSYIFILAVGMVLVIVAGHIDLSVGFLAGTCGAITALLQSQFGIPDIMAIGIGLLVGFIVGTWQGYWIAYRRVPAFIVTLSGMLVFKGVLILVTGGQTITPEGDDFRKIGDAYIPQVVMHGSVGNEVPFHDLTMLVAIVAVMIFIVMQIRNRAVRKKYNFEVLPVPLEILKLVLVSALIMAFFAMMLFYRGIPWSIVIVGALVLIFEFVTRKTIFGRQIYALGGNKEAARLSGVNIEARTMVIFMIMGVLSALSGIVYTARLNSATAAAGTLFELDAIAAAIIGGASTLGGEGTIIGAIIGALVMGTLNNGMGLMDLPIAWQYVVKGLVLLFAVWFDISTRTKKN